MCHIRVPAFLRFIKFNSYHIRKKLSNHYCHSVNSWPFMNSGLFFVIVIILCFI